MKRLAAVLVAGTLLLGATGCGAEKSEAYWDLKAQCIKGTYQSVADKKNPVIKTWEQLDTNCGKSAEAKLSK